jgi:hypothetical protein
LPLLLSIFNGSILDVRCSARDAFAVIGKRGDDAGNVGAVSKIVVGRAARRDVVDPGQQPSRQVRMAEVYAAVDHRHAHGLLCQAVVSDQLPGARHIAALQVPLP